MYGHSCDCLLFQLGLCHLSWLRYSQTPTDALHYISFLFTSAARSVVLSLPHRISRRKTFVQTEGENRTPWHQPTWHKWNDNFIFRNWRKQHTANRIRARLFLCVCVCVSLQWPRAAVKTQGPKIIWLECVQDGICCNYLFIQHVFCLHVFSWFVFVLFFTLFILVFVFVDVCHCCGCFFCQWRHIGHSALVGHRMFMCRTKATRPSRCSANVDYPGCGDQKENVWVLQVKDVKDGETVPTSTLVQWRRDGRNRPCQGRPVNSRCVHAAVSPNL